MAGTGSRTGSNAKYWNTKMDQVEADEQIYTDYKDDKCTQVTNLKFKTTSDRIDAWIAAHREYFPEPNCWDYKANCVKLRVEDAGKGTLFITFHMTTGVVLIQGSMHEIWKTDYFSALQCRVSELRLQSSNGVCSDQEYSSDVNIHLEDATDDVTDEKIPVEAENAIKQRTTNITSDLGITEKSDSLDLSEYQVTNKSDDHVTSGLLKT